MTELLATPQLPLVAHTFSQTPLPKPSGPLSQSLAVPHADIVASVTVTEWLDEISAVTSEEPSPPSPLDCSHETSGRAWQIAKTFAETTGRSVSRTWAALTKVFSTTHVKSAQYVFTYASDESHVNGTQSKAEHGVIPDYILEYAPYCYLYSEEEYWPGLMQVHLDHTTPYINYTPVDDKYRNRNLDNLDELNGLGRMYLQSNDDPESYPDWLGGGDNIPPGLSASKRSHQRSFRAADEPHRSPAPAVLIAVDKGDFVDAFWFFFYSFNLGNQVLGVRFGNHVGDWEHTTIRFSKKTGKPIEVFYSEHEWGAAYRWKDTEKHDDKRMLTYSAFGTHAMYRTSGAQRYVLPFGLLQDTTDRGPLWDPTLNLYAYTYDPLRGTLRASTLTPDVPENWFHFSGHWGDKKYPMDDPRQYRFAGELHYDSGPTGPKFKNLGRRHICQNEDTCLKHIDLSGEAAPTVITKEMWQLMQRRKRLAML